MLRKHFIHLPNKKRVAHRCNLFLIIDSQQHCSLVVYKVEMVIRTKIKYICAKLDNNCTIFEKVQDLVAKYPAELIRI